MGTVIGFPEREQRKSRAKRLIAAKSESATVIILPVIRIERMVEEPEQSATRSQRRRRRRRASRH
jgi:hypothetical protein